MCICVCAGDTISVSCISPNRVTDYPWQPHLKSQGSASPSFPSFYNMDWLEYISISQCKCPELTLTFCVGLSRTLCTPLLCPNGSFESPQKELTGIQSFQYPLRAVREEACQLSHDHSAVWSSLWDASDLQTELMLAIDPWRPSGSQKMHDLWKTLFWREAM